MKDLDKYRGCLIGGAVGDALGYAIEFLDETSIFKRYGKNGITEYDLVEGVAEISDDTQMTSINNQNSLSGIAYLIKTDYNYIDKMEVVKGVYYYD